MNVSSNKIKKMYGFDNAEENNVQQKANKLLGIEGESENRTSSKTFNPFLKRDGSLVNPYYDYQKALNSDRTASTTKKYIQEATGLTPTAVQKTEKTDDGSDISFNANANPDGLAGMDVATELPKLNSKQIAKIISNHFGNSSVIRPSDAEGIYKAQQNTGMSALAILGIGALESGWGTSNIANKTNNIWGYGATNVNPEGNAHRYSQMSDGASQFASEFMKTYYNGYGAKSIYSAGTGNNPAGKGYAYYDNGSINSNWATNVGSIMKTLYNTAKSA